MKLERLTERVWILPFEEARDRPNLGYIRGDNWSLAVDAGHSDDHVALFYRAIEEEGLPLPKVTVLTHWHWDHTFGMHAVRGLCAANVRTNGHLRGFRAALWRDGTGMFLGLHESIRREYAGNHPVVVTLADMVFTGSMAFDLGGCAVRALQAESPHTDDATLVLVPEEKTLFLGDACCGVFPTWEKDMALAAKLAETVSGIDADICVQGHWTPQSRREVVEEDILSQEG